jgi:hypothetical protein
MGNSCKPHASSRRQIQKGSQKDNKKGALSDKDGAPFI